MGITETENAKIRIVRFYFVPSSILVSRMTETLFTDAVSDIQSLGERLGIPERKTAARLEESFL
jgi:hypothetical protein